MLRPALLSLLLMSSLVFSAESQGGEIIAQGRPPQPWGGVIRIEKHAKGYKFVMQGGLVGPKGTSWAVKRKGNTYFKEGGDEAYHVTEDSITAVDGSGVIYVAPRH